MRLPLRGRPELPFRLRSGLLGSVTGAAPPPAASVPGVACRASLLSCPVAGTWRCDSRCHHAAPGGLICCSGAVPLAATSALPAFRPARGIAFQLMPWGTGVECGVGP